MEHPKNELDRGKPKYLGNPCPSDPSSTIYPSRTDPIMNPEIQNKKGLIDRMTN